MYKILIRQCFFKKALCFLLIGMLIISNASLSHAQALSLSPTAIAAPAPTTVLRGLKVYPQDPFRFDFVVEHQKETDKDEAHRLIKYFLASLTIPEQDLWVNLSPYEKDRIVPESFGQTEMGRDLLAQDYVLKQITSSLMNPQEEVGKAFWEKIYQKAQEKFGTTDIPIDTFNKVWIVPAKAVVYENAQSKAIYIVESKLNVMLETDYLAESKNAMPIGGHNVDDSLMRRGASRGARTEPEGESDSQSIAQEILKEIIIPVLEKEVNEGASFKMLRQIYHSLILATWYKEKLRKSVLSKIYIDQEKIQGVQIQDKKEAQEIWQTYWQAFQQGAYDVIREEKDGQDLIVPRRYFSGGASLKVREILKIEDAAFLQGKEEVSVIPVEIKPVGKERQQEIVGPLKSQMTFDDDIFSLLDPQDQERMFEILKNGNDPNVLKKVFAKPWGTQLKVQRSVMMPLKKVIQHQGKKYRAMYIKGVLISSQKEIGVLYNQDAGQPIKSRWMEDGKVVSQMADAVPLGTMEFLFAKEEYEKMKALIQQGFHTNLPLGYGVFDRKFSYGKVQERQIVKEVGYFMALVEDINPYRFLYHIQQKAMNGGGFFDQEGGVDVERYLQDLKQDIVLLAKTLRRFHRWGKHGNPNMDNIAVSRVKKDVFIVDVHDVLPWEEVIQQDRLGYLLTDWLSILMGLSHIAQIALFYIRDPKLKNKDVEQEIREIFFKTYFQHVKTSKSFSYLKKMIQTDLSLILFVIDNVLLREGTQVALKEHGLIDILNEEFQEEFQTDFVQEQENNQQALGGIDLSKRQIDFSQDKGDLFLDDQILNISVQGFECQIGNIYRIEHLEMFLK